ncbi:MAG: hypothetical protein AAGD11_07190 [Planctomycetota bacterium]
MLSSGLRLMFVAAFAALAAAGVAAGSTLTERSAAAIELLQLAEDRFRAPDPTWFETTRQALQEETARVDEALESHGSEYAQAWKQHLRWPKLTSNLGDSADVDLAELELVRRWLYSNREGLEYPFFAKLRTNVDAHLDAAFTFGHADLEASFRQKIQLLRTQLLELAQQPDDSHAAALGQTLGWFERTRQLEEEVAAVRQLVSFPNAQIVVGKPMLDRAVAVLATQVQQTLPVFDRLEVPNASITGRSRTAKVRGVASTRGQISLSLEDNGELADVRLVYRGDIDSHCRAFVGPVSIAMRTLGPVQAITPVQLSLAGVNLLTTDVEPDVRTRVTGVSSKSELFRRIGRRRAAEPESYRQMNSRAAYKATSLLRTEMDERVSTVIEDIRAEILAARSSFEGFGDIFAPVVREGATPHWHGLKSTPETVVIQGANQRRHQLAAPTPPPSDNDWADLQVQLHTSFFNNMLETIMAGKTFTDRYFMRYGRILQAQLPPPLMVHARSTRWAVIAAKPRPLEISIPAPNRFDFQLRMQQVTIGKDDFTGPTIANVRYKLVRNEYQDYDEYYLERIGEVEIDSPMPTDKELFLKQKLNAFFAPIMDGTGVAIPEGGTLNRLRSLKLQGVRADSNWLALGVNVPTTFLEELLPTSTQEDEQ